MILVISCFVVKLTTIYQNVLNVNYNDFGKSEVIVCFIIVVFSIFHLSLIKKNNHLKHVFMPLIYAYLFRIFLLFWDLYFREIFNLKNSGADSEHFFGLAKAIASGININYMLFVSCMGEFYKVVGVSRLFSQFLLMLCSMVTLYVIVFVLNKLKIDKQIQYKTITIVGLLPNFAILSSIYLRESIVTMFASLSVLCFVYWMYDKKEIYLGFAIIFTLISSAFHTGAIALLAGFIVVRYLYLKKDNRFEINIKNIIPVLLFIVMFSWLYQNHSETFFTKIQDVESIEDISQNIERGSSSYAMYVGASSGISGIMIYSLPRMFFFLFSPLPWQWRGIQDIIAFIFSSYFYLYIIVLAIRKVKKFKYTNYDSLNDIQHTIFMGLGILALFTTFVFGWGCNNTGTAIRHRDKMMCIYAVMLSIVINEKQKVKNQFS